MPKQTLSTRAVVIREVSVGEADKLLTLLTPTLGKITARCQGVRSLKSRRFAASQLYAYSDMLLSEKGELYMLEEAEVLETFFELRSSLEAIACANYFAELVGAVTVEGEEAEGILRLFLNTLYRLGKKSDSFFKIKGVFEVRLTALLGLAPDLSACSLCGKRDFSEGWLNLSEGLPICADCTFEERPSLDGEEQLLVPLSGGALSLYRYVLDCEDKKIFSFSAEEGLLEEFSRVSERFLLYHVGRNFDTLDFLHRII